MANKRFCDNMIRIKNGYRAGRDSVKLEYSKLTQHTLDVLKQEGCIDSYLLDNGSLTVNLRYTGRINKKPALLDLKLCSTPSRVNYGPVPRPTYTFSFYILSTNKGVLPGYKAKELNVGGVILAEFR